MEAFAKEVVDLLNGLLWGKILIWLLVGTFVVIESGWYSVYALGGRSLVRWLAPAARRRLFNRATGLLFIGFGGALLGARV